MARGARGFASESQSDHPQAIDTPMLTVDPSLPKTTAALRLLAAAPFIMLSVQF